MYDKSKKTWSQRLKIHKNEKLSQAATATENINNNSNNNTASVTTATKSKTFTTSNSQIPIEPGIGVATKQHSHQAVLEAALNVAHNVNIARCGSTSSSSGRASMPQYQIATPTAIMHLPPSLSDYHATGTVSSQAYEYMTSHMGRSMKYAEPWIYGTVRGIPARPAGIYHPAYMHYAGHPHAATIFAATSTNEMASTAAAAITPAVAVVLCSCPEYLSGTKGRTLKKPSICKKCKGTRLPLHNIGGTLRLPCNVPSPRLMPVGNSQTVRVVSTSKKIRPTILDPQKDPYDLMRRTRLLSPEPGSSAAGVGGVGLANISGNSGGVTNKEKLRQRGKSASPVRGRSRTRHHKLLLNSSKESSKALENFDDNWLTESEDLAALTASSKAAANNRKSILRCNVNPYDLISINNQSSTVDSTSVLLKEGNKKPNRNAKLKFSQNEFMPPNDDFNVQDAALSEEDPPFVLRASKMKEDSVKTENNKKLIEEPPPPQTLSPSTIDKPQSKSFNYMNVQAIAGQRISLGEEQQTSKSLLQQTVDGTTNYENFDVATNTQTTNTKEMEKAVKPRPDSLEVVLAEPKRPPRAAKQPQQNVSSESKETPNNSQDFAEDEEELKVTVTVTPTYNIKSILKRPSSKVSENGDTLPIDDANNIPVTTSTPYSKQRDSTGNSSKTSTPTNARRHQSTAGTPTANSQFYIPLPQARKKVQFLMEEYGQTTSDPEPDDEEENGEGEEQEEDESFYEISSSSSPSAADLKANYEYYNKKRNIKKLEPFETLAQEHDSEAEVIIYDEQFIQAMLLEKLQLDSEMVTKRFNASQHLTENDEKTNITTTATETATVIATNNKTDYEMKISNDTNKPQLEYQNEFKNENNVDDDRNDKHYFNENLSNDTTTSLSLSTTSLMETNNSDTTTIAIQSSTVDTASVAAAGTQSCHNCDTILKPTKRTNAKTYMNNDDDEYGKKTDDTDNSNNDDDDGNDKCLACKENNNSNDSNDDDDDNIIIVRNLKECDKNTNNNSSNNHDDNDDDENFTHETNNHNDNQQHLFGNDESKKPKICHHNDNNHQHRHHQQQKELQQLKNVKTLDNEGNNDDYDDGVDSASSLTPVLKVQQNEAKKSTTSDYDDDDDAKTKQQHQQHKYQELEKNKFKKDMQETLAAIAADNTITSSSSSNSISVSTSVDSNDSVSKTGSRKPTKETQSRNPIRRSQSERQPMKPTKIVTAASTATAIKTTSHNSNLKKKKDQQQQQHKQQQCKDFAYTHVADKGGNSDSNKNIISNTRNSLKDLENIQKTNINDNRRSAIECSSTKSKEITRSTGRARGMSNKTSLHFHDTMALRNRYNRNDSRDLFQTTMALIGRPREPPPPPPSLSSTALSQSAVEKTLKAVDMANAITTTTSALCNSSTKTEDFEKSTKVITLATEAILSFEQQQQQQQRQQNLNGLENSKQQIEQKLAIAQEKYTVNAKEINDDSSIKGEHEQQMVVGIAKTFNSLTTKEKTSMDLSSTTVASTSSLATTLATDNNSRQSTIWPTLSTTSTTTIGHNKQHQQQQQRTVVRVAPFNKNSSEIHRLKISHTDNNETIASSHSPSAGLSHSSSHYSVTDLSLLNGLDCNEYGQKKTSILINGDDCYSTMNLSCDDACTPLYQSSVVVTDGSYKINDNDFQGLRVTNTYNTVTINVSSPRSSEDELIQQHNQLNNLLKRQIKSSSSSGMGSIRAIIPIRGTIDINLQRSASSTSSTSTSSMTSSCSSTSSSSGINATTPKRGKTLIRLDYDNNKRSSTTSEAKISSTLIKEPMLEEEVMENNEEWLPHETELLKILRNPVEAVKRNLVPHICKLREADTQKDIKRSKKMKERHSDILETSLTSISSSQNPTSPKATEMPSFIGKLLEDPMLQQVAEGLETDTVAELIENSLKRLQGSRNSLDMSGTKDNEDMNRLIDLSLKRIQEERSSPQKDSAITCHNSNLLNVPSTKDEERLSNRGSISSANSFASAHNYELFDFEANESDCYQSCSSDINSIIEEDIIPSAETKSKFYQMLVDATLQEIELSTNVEDLHNDEEHQYESIRQHADPIYEEISDVPPPLPLTAPPLSDPELEKKSARSIFEGASKYDILSYLVDAKERGLVKEESFDYPPLNCSNPIIIEEESADTLTDLSKLNKLKRIDTISSRSSIMSDSSDDNQSTMSSLSPPTSNNFLRSKQATSDIERNDSGVGSETSKTSRSKFLNPTTTTNTISSASSTPTTTSGGALSATTRSSPLHLCEDCDGPVETQISENGHIFAPLVCRKCGKKRVERKEIITEVVETEEKYGRDLQIILEEFCHPMLVAGLLTQEQLSAIFLNTEELLENNQTLAERMRDALDIALEQGDDDLLTVNIGKIFLESTQMLHAFESYCVRQAGASLLLANLEKEKELLRIFLKVSQMENAVLRRMNLNSFLMVPVQRVTKYPLLLARLYKVTPAHLEGREQLKQAQEKIELHLNHINQEAKDVPTKLWRRISSSSPNRRASCEIDMINIKLRKMAIDVLEWNHDEVRFVMEGKLLYTQPTDSNWKKARTIKLTTVNALLVTNGKPSSNYKAEKVMSDKLNFPKHTGIREASLLVVKEKCGRYTLIREPLYLDRCVVCSEADWDEYFEIQEISSKDTFIFKAEDNVRTKQWYTQLQYHAQGMGAWRKRRNALANIMINGMLTRS